MEEKGFRQLRCHSCNVLLKFPVTEKVYGKRVTVPCPRCKASNRVLVPVPPKPASTNCNPFDLSPAEIEYMDILLNFFSTKK